VLPTPVGTLPASTTRPARWPVAPGSGAAAQHGPVGRSRLGRLSHALGAWLLLWALALCLGSGTATAAKAGAEAPATCPGPLLDFRPLAPGLWWLPGAPGDADAHNRGHVSNLLLAIDGRRVWLIGSGPTPAFGQALACQVRQRWGRPVTDVVSPWPRPELVLGVAGLGAARHWAHAEVALAMQQRCAACVERLRVPLGEAASDLGDAPVRVPTRLLHGSEGRLGPWRWWRWSRGPGFPVTAWQFRSVALRHAPGLLWSGGAPDARDADIATLLQSTTALGRTAPQDAAAAPLRWLGEQGPPEAGLPARHQRYWADLLRDVALAQERGDDESAGAPASAHVPPGDPRHALNWQRAWRQVEGGTFQRSLR
jgi:hypothetical protein